MEKVHMGITAHYRPKATKTLGQTRVSFMSFHAHALVRLFFLPHSASKQAVYALSAFWDKYINSPDLSNPSHLSFFHLTLEDLSLYLPLHSALISFK